MSKRALGKGLDALIQPKENDKASSPSTPSSTLPLERIDPSADQPRTHFDSDRLNELAESIRNQGVIQPIVVEAQGDRFTIVAGERRFRAAQLAGLTEIPAVVASYGTEKRLLVSLIENLQREDLDPIEEADAYRRILDTSHLNQEQLAEQIGKNRATIANSLRLLNLPDTIKNSIRSGEVTSGHARALLAAGDEATRESIYTQIVENGISVREAERLARPESSGDKKATKSRTGKKKAPPEIQDLEQQFIEALGTKVRISGSVSKGTLEISYFSRDDLQRIYDILINE